jgi:hypothetical protein
MSKAWYFLFVFFHTWYEPLLNLSILTHLPPLPQDIMSIDVARHRFDADLLDSTKILLHMLDNPNFFYTFIHSSVSSHFFLSFSSAS